MSTHRVDVIQIDTIEPHPNADTLGLVHIDQFVCAVRLGEFQPGDLAVYIEPDYVAPDTEQFEFLGKPGVSRSVSCVVSTHQGLLVPAPPGSRVGDDVMESWGSSLRAASSEDADCIHGAARPRRAT